MMNFYTHNGLYVADSGIAGLGVFTSMHIPSGTRIQACPILAVPEVSDPNNPTSQEFLSHLYEFGDELVIALGWGALYNHSDTPNAIYAKDLKKRMIEFRAIHDIQGSTEITVHYEHGNPSVKPFVGMGIPSK